MDDGRGVAWLSYLPIPGLALLAVALGPQHRLVRYHAWQGGLLVGATFVVLMLMGMLALASDARPYRLTVGFLCGLVVLGGFFLLGWGGVAAATGRYARIRPGWDLAALLRRA